MDEDKERVLALVVLVISMGGISYILGWGFLKPIALLTCSILAVAASNRLFYQ